MCQRTEHVCVCNQPGDWAAVKGDCGHETQEYLEVCSRLHRLPSESPEGSRVQEIMVKDNTAKRVTVAHHLLGTNVSIVKTTLGTRQAYYRHLRDEEAESSEQKKLPKFIGQHVAEQGIKPQSV